MHAKRIDRPSPVENSGPLRASHTRTEGTDSTSYVDADAVLDLVRAAFERDHGKRVRGVRWTVGGEIAIDHAAA